MPLEAKPLERRFVSEPLEVRADESRAGVKTITGYAAVFNSDSDPIGFGSESFTERLMPGAFAAALADRARDVLGLFNHSSDQLLGRESSGTLRIAQDERGLRFELDLPDTGLGRDIAELVRRGDIRGASFAFSVAADGDTFVRRDGKLYREIRSIARLFDVSPVTTPAYPDTSVATRSAEAFVVAEESGITLDEARATVAWHTVRINEEAGRD